MAERDLKIESREYAIRTAERLDWLDMVVRAIVVLNLLDAVFTLIWIRSGIAVEGNAFMRDLAHGPAFSFVMAKIVLVSLGCLFLWGRRTHRLAVVAIFVAFAVYYLVLLVHLAAWSHHGLAFWAW